MFLCSGDTKCRGALYHSFHISYSLALLHFSVGNFETTVELLIRVPSLSYALMGGASYFTSNALVSAVQTGFRKLDWNT